MEGSLAPASPGRFIQDLPSENNVMRRHACAYLPISVAEFHSSFLSNVDGTPNQYVNPSASKLIIDYDYTWKGDLHVTPIEISNGFGVDRIRARL